MALGPIFPVTRAEIPCLASSSAACIPAPLGADELRLAMEFSLMLSRSINTKNGQRPNLGSTGESIPAAAAVTHIFIYSSLLLT